MKLSIIITTLNRNVKLHDCINSILQNTWKNFEIILIDQNTPYDSSFNQPKLKYIHTGQIGKSKAFNIGIKQSTGDVLVFTDDDCIVSKRWLVTIQQTFYQFPEIAGVFGKTLPYKPNEHKDHLCPSTFENEKSNMISRPGRHWKIIGFGSNMAFRKKTLESWGGFKEWLGPGTVGISAEDAELALRMILRGEKLYYNSKVIVYHNRWLTHKEYQTQELFYACGGMASYGYFLFQGYQFAKPIIKLHVMDSYGDIRYIIKSFFIFRWNKQMTITAQNKFLETLYRIRGLLIGFWFSRIDPMK